MATDLTPRQHEENAVFPLADYIVSVPHRFVACAIPKNGCTVLKRWFLSVAEPGVEHVDVHGPCRDYHALHLLPTEQAEACLREFFTFVLVRDPLKRIASAFAEKFVGPALHEVFEPAREVIEENERLHGAIAPHDTVAEVRFPERTVVVPACSAIAYARGLTFREFVRYLCASPDHHLDNHWRPQACFLAGNRFNVVGRADRLSRLLPAVARRIGVPAPALPEHTPAADVPGEGPIHADILSRELHRRGIYPSAATLYDDELKALVLDRYAEDVRLYQDAIEFL